MARSPPPTRAPETVTSPPSGPPFGPSRWPFRWVAFVLAVTAFGAGVPTPLYALYQQQYHFSSLVLTAIFAAYAAGVLATMLLIGPLADFVGRKPVLYAGMALTAASGVVFLLASGVLLLALARVVSGLAVGATTSTSNAAMSSLEPRRDQHHVARVSVAANFGGVASGVLLSGFLVADAPQPTHLVFGVLILASLVGMVAVASTPETGVRSAAEGRPRLQRPTVPSGLRGPFWVAAGSLAACYAIYGYFGAMAPTFLRHDLGVPNPTSAALVATMFGLAAIVQLWLGQVRDRRALLIGLPTILGATLLLTVAWPIPSYPLFVVGDAALGIGIGFAYMGSVTLIDRVSPATSRGDILSAFFTVGYVSLAIPTIGVGAVASAFGLVVAASSFGVVLAVAVALLYRATRATPTPPGGEGRPRGADGQARPPG